MVRDILLILLMLSLLPIGFFVMVRLDRFLSAESPKNEEKKEETLPAEGPKQIFLSEIPPMKRSWRRSNPSARAMDISPLSSGKKRKNSVDLPDTL